MTNSLNILFVDDDEDFGEGCARWFQRKGYQVAICTSGQDGLDLCNHHDFDIAILDWNLPALCGLELVRRQKWVKPLFHRDRTASGGSSVFPVDAWLTPDLIFSRLIPPNPHRPSEHHVGRSFELL